MQTPVQWAWEVPLPPEAHATRVVLLALAAYAAPIWPGSTTVRLGVVDPTLPAVADLAGMSADEVARHVAALVRADVLVPAPSPHTVVRFNEAVTAETPRCAQVIADTLDVLPAAVPSLVAVPATTEDSLSADQPVLVDVPAGDDPRPATRRKTRTKTAVAPEEQAARDVVTWWWEHWTSTVGPVSNGAAFSAHAKRLAALMLAEGYPVERIKDAFIAIDQPRPTEWALRNHLRGKSPRGPAVRETATTSATQYPERNPFGVVQAVSGA